MSCCWARNERAVAFPAPSTRDAAGNVTAVTEGVGAYRHIIANNYGSSAVSTVQSNSVLVNNERGSAFGDVYTKPRDM